MKSILVHTLPRLVDFIFKKKLEIILNHHVFFPLIEKRKYAVEIPNDNHNPRIKVIHINLIIKSP